MDLYEVIGEKKANTIVNIVTSIEKLELLHMYSEDLQELLNSYVIQLQKELNDYSNRYEKFKLEE